MNNPNTHDQRIAKMTFATVYPMYVAKVQKKGRTEKELRQVIEWLTGFDGKKLQELIRAKATFESFFGQAALNPNARFKLISAVSGEALNRASGEEVSFILQSFWTTGRQDPCTTTIFFTGLGKCRAPAIILSSHLGF